VAYLRTVAGVDHEVPDNPPPPTGPFQPPTPVDISGLPSPAPGSPNYDSAMRGRYLVVNTGACLGCHTPEGADHAPDMSRAFAGGHTFDPAHMGRPVPPWPAEIASANLTSDATGLAQWSADDIVHAMMNGVEPDGGAICPPMPSGPAGPYAHLHPEDALDIAHYLQSLPPIANQVPECNPPAPPGP
jgi:mono/diheme cytochrome c family protein